MKKHLTTTDMLPTDVQQQYEIVGDLEGGPRFDLPAQKMYGVDFTKITKEQCALLVRRKFKHLREKPGKPLAKIEA